jgi:hypothetical protein
MALTDLARLPKINQVEYKDQYFSGVQSKIFFGNVWVDDIVTINWDLVEQKAPLYGYASDKYDAVARGTQIVQGVFTIAFKHKDYINVILDALNARGEGKRNILERLKENKARKAYEARQQGKAKYGPPVTTNYARILDDALKEDSGADYSGMRTFLEDRIWGQIIQGLREQPIDKDKNLQTIVSGFDIVATYGNPTNHPDEWTSKTINDCHVTGIRQILQPTGEPVLEAYTFFGKMMDPYRIDEKKAPMSERASDPFGGQFGGHGTELAQRVLETSAGEVEPRESVKDSEGNEIEDDPFDAPDEGAGGPTLKRVTILQPASNETKWMFDNTMPVITAEALAVGLPDGLQNKVQFNWLARYTIKAGGVNRNNTTTFELSTTGRFATFDFSAYEDRGFILGSGDSMSGGSCTIRVVATYGGVDMMSDPVTIVVLNP